MQCNALGGRKMDKRKPVTRGPSSPVKDIEIRWQHADVTSQGESEWANGTCWLTTIDLALKKTWLKQTGFPHEPANFKKWSLHCAVTLSEIWDSHGGEYEDGCLLGNLVQKPTKSSWLQNISMTMKDAFKLSTSITSLVVKTIPSENWVLTTNAFRTGTTRNLIPAVFITNSRKAGEWQPSRSQPLTNQSINKIRANEPYHKPRWPGCP
jgi:hypothetical protein